MRGFAMACVSGAGQPRSRAVHRAIRRGGLSSRPTLSIADACARCACGGAGMWRSAVVGRTLLSCQWCHAVLAVKVCALPCAGGLGGRPCT